MPERLELIEDLLHSAIEGQAKGNAMLADLRVEIAALQRSHDGQGQNIADMRAEMRQMGDRLRDVELRIQPLASLEARHSALESRVRTLEGDGREAAVVNRAVTGGARDVWRYVVGAIVATAAWAIAGLIKLGVPLQ